MLPETLLPVLISSTFFSAGFFVGYIVRAWRSKKRRVKYVTYARWEEPQTKKSNEAQPQISAFGHPRRAF